MINGFFVTDAHCHIYPEKIAERAIHGTDTFYGEHSVGTGTVGNLIETGGRAGIDRFVVIDAVNDCFFIQVRRAI